MIIFKLIYLLVLIAITKINAQKEVGYIYIDTNQTTFFILAESSTYPFHQNLTLTIKTSLVSVDEDISFKWSLRPVVADRFFSFDGTETIARNTNSTTVTISLNDNEIPELEDQNFIFKLDSVLPLNNQSVLYVVNNTQSVIIHVLPSDYPFGLFEFSNDISSNLTISKYSKTAKGHVVTVKRYYGTAFRVLVTCDQIEIINNTLSSYKTSVYAEFVENESQKDLVFNYLGTSNDTQQSSLTYPRAFLIKISMLKLLDGMPFSNETNQYLSIASDILPTIGNNSVIQISIIDDKSVIQFSNNSLQIYVQSAYGQNNYANLSVTRTDKNVLYPNLSIDFITYPVDGNLNSSSSFNAALEYFDYSPVNGQVYFDNDKFIANLKFLISQKLESNISTFNSTFQVVLVNINNCDSCIIGLNRIATVYLIYKKKSFNDLFQLSFIDNSINLNPSTNKSQSLCFQRKLNRSIIVNYQLIANNDTLISPDQLIRINYTSSNTSFNSTQGDLKNGTFIFKDNSSSNCIQFSLIDDLNNLTNTCVNYKYTLQFTTRFIISESNSIFSNIISNDNYTLNLINNNCPTITFSNYVMANNRNYTNITTDYKTYIKLDTNNNTVSFKVPVQLLKIRQNQTGFNETILTYDLKVDDRLSSYFLLNTNQVVVSTKQTNQTNMISFSLVNLNSFQYRSIQFNLTIYRDPNGIFSVSDDSLQNSQTMLFYISVKPVNSSNSCGVVSLNKQLSKLFIANAQRILYLIFDGEQSNLSCIVNLNYTISLLNSSKSIDTLIDRVSENYFFAFTPKLNSVKDIEIRNDAYLDENDVFVINIDSIIDVTNKFSQPLFNSIDDKQLLLRPIPNVANGDAYLTSELVTIYNDSNYQQSLIYNINNRFYRNVNYSRAEANYDLYLFNSTSDNMTISKDNVYSRVYTLLGNGETQSMSKISLQNLSMNYDLLSYSNMVLYGKTCFYNEANLLLKCTKSNDTIYVEPYGIFQFDQSSLNMNIIIDNSTYVPSNDSMISINVTIERRFGSKESVDVYYNIKSKNSLTDFYLLKYQNFITFNSGEYKKQISIKFDYVYLLSPLDLYVIITKTQLSNCNCNMLPLAIDTNQFTPSTKYDKFNNIVKLRVSSKISRSNVIAFSKNLQIVPMVWTNQTSFFDLVLPIYRISPINYNATQNFSCNIQTIGYAEQLPDYIIVNQYSQELSSSSLAYPTKDYQPISSKIEFKSTETIKNVTVRILNTYFSDDAKASMEDVKVFYINLYKPQNGAFMIEPNDQNAYSPFIKIEVHKLLPNNPNANISIQNLTVGFLKVNNSVDQTAYIDNIIDNDSLLKYTIVSDRIINSNLLSTYQIKWTAELIKVNLIQNMDNVTIQNLLECSYYQTYKLNTQTVTRCEELINCNVNSTTCFLNIKFKNRDLLVTNYTLRLRLFSLNNDFNSNFMNISIDQNASVSLLNLVLIYCVLV